MFVICDHCGANMAGTVDECIEFGAIHRHVGAHAPVVRRFAVDSLIVVNAKSVNVVNR